MRILGKAALAAFFLGLSATASPARADPLRLLLPTAVGSVTDVNGDGTGDTLSSGAFISRTNGAVEAALLEYDISGLQSVRWASVELVLRPQDFIYTGTRRMSAYVYAGNGSVDTADFAAPGVFVGTRSFDPGADPSVGGWAFQFAVKHQLRAALQQGATSFGVRFVPRNDQTVSTLQNYRATSFGTPNEPPFLIVNPAPIPEPSSMLLVGSGALGLVAFARRRRRSMAVAKN